MKMLAQLDKNWKPRNDTYVITPNAKDGKVLVWGYDVKNLEKYNGMNMWRLSNVIGQLERELNNNAKLLHINPLMGYAEICLSEFIKDNIVKLPKSAVSAKEVVRLLGTLVSCNGMHEPDDELFLEKSLLPGFLENFQTILGAEVPELNIFYVNKILNLDMKGLIEKGEESLSPSTLAALKDFVRETQIIEEIRESARCLAFGFPNAVGFHIYRALEYILVEYLDLHKIPFHGDADHPTLGKYAHIFRKKEEAKGKIHVKIIQRLENVAEHYRNDCIHNITWDLDTACSAFSDAISFIQIIVADIDNKRKATINQTAPAPLVLPSDPSVSE